MSAILHPALSQALRALHRRRARDLTPVPASRFPRSGGAPRSLRFMREELYPFVDAGYRTRSDAVLYTAVGEEESACFVDGWKELAERLAARDDSGLRMKSEVLAKENTNMAPPVPEAHGPPRR